MIVRFALLWLLILAPVVHGQDAHDPLQSALAQARERRVPLLVDFTAPWCYSCYFMAAHVLNGAEWARAHREAVVLELDADSPEGARVMEAWGVKAMPTYLLIGSDGQERGRLLGEQSRGDFYRWLFATIGRDSLAAVQARVVDGGDASVAAAREVLRAFQARYDAEGGLAWFLAQPLAVRAALARDAVASSWVARLELQRAVAEKDVPGCLNVAPAALAGALGCERPYELAKVLACSKGEPETGRRALLEPQVESMQRLVNERVLSQSRCADERSIVMVTADLHAALGDTTAEARVLERAIADLHARSGADAGAYRLETLRRDRTLADNLRVYLERAGRLDELDALLVALIEAYPEDYVYPYRRGRSLAARGRHAEAVPLYEQAAAKAYGINRLRLAELHARSLQALARHDDARRLLAGVLRANGPWFREEAAKLKALLDTLPAPVAGS